METVLGVLHVPVISEARQLFCFVIICCVLSRQHGRRLVIDVEPIDVSEVRYRNDQSCGVSLYLTVFLIVQYKVDIYELLGQIGKKII